MPRFDTGAGDPVRRGRPSDEVGRTDGSTDADVSRLGSEDRPVRTDGGEPAGGPAVEEPATATPGVEDPVVDGVASLAARAEDAVSDRLLAYVVDFFVLSAVTFVIWLVFFTLAWLLTVFLEIPGGFLARLVMWPIIGAAVFGYFTYLDGATKGTLGKRFIGLEVVSGDGSSAGLKATAIRTIVLLVPFPFMALIGFLLSWFGFAIAVVLMAGWLAIEAAVLALGGGRRLGDRAAGTYVVPTE